MNLSMYTLLKRAGCGIMSVNLAFVVVLLRSGLREAAARLRLGYRELRPFDSAPVHPANDIRDLVQKYCRGHGLEIGPGQNPYCDHSHTNYVDRFPGRREGCVPPDMVADACGIPVANTIEVLIEWKRVVKPGGVVFLVLPHADRTFDKGRPKTTLRHHIDDFESGVDYGDETHLPEWESTVLNSSVPHRWTANPEARDPDGSLNREWMIANGKVHYHVWTQNEVIALLAHVGFGVAFVLEESEVRPDSFIVVARA
ncbi:MAG: hypothetical protein ACYTDY_14040 [Planctomycetota bacterium]|jgi:hypothetical protein